MWASNGCGHFRGSNGCGHLRDMRNDVTAHVLGCFWPWAACPAFREVQLIFVSHDMLCMCYVCDVCAQILCFASTLSYYAHICVMLCMYYLDCLPERMDALNMGCMHVLS
jgi:hypothetical protein